MLIAKLPCCGGTVLQIIEYVGLPPKTVNVAEPFDNPQDAVVFKVADNGLGSIMFTVRVEAHKFASFTKQVYELADKLLAVADVPPEGDQLYVKAPVPLLAEIVTEPLLPPKQLTLV